MDDHVLFVVYISSQPIQVIYLSMMDRYYHETFGSLYLPRLILYPTNGYLWVPEVTNHKYPLVGYRISLIFCIDHRRFCGKPLISRKIS